MFSLRVFKVDLCSIRVYTFGMDEPSIDSEHIKSPNPLFEGVNKCLIVILGFFILVVIGELYLLFRQKQLQKNQTTETKQSTTNQTQTNQPATVGSTVSATSRYNEYFFNNVKRNTAPNNANEQLLTVKHKLFKIVNLKTDDGLIITVQPAETTGPVGNLALSFAKTTEDKFSVWDFTSGNRQAVSVDTLKLDQNIWITETLDIKQSSYDSAIHSVMVEIVP